MFTLAVNGVPTRHWTEGDPEPLDCDAIQDSEGFVWRRGKEWTIPIDWFQAHGIPAGANAWTTEENDQDTWESILSYGVVREYWG